MSTLASRLKQARLEKGELWSQKHLAIASGVSIGTIGMMESGKRGNKGSIPGTVPQIAKALGVRFEWLAYGEEPRTDDASEVFNPMPGMQEHLQQQITQLAILLNSVPMERQMEAYVVASQALIRFLPGAAPTPLLGAPDRSKKPLA